MRGLLRAAAVALVAMALLPASAMADGQLDPSFGTGGRVILSHAAGAGSEGASALALLGGGRFLSAGIGQGNGIWVTQNLASGAFDGSFGVSGSAFFAPGGFTFVGDAVRETDGAIVVVGGHEPTTHFDTMIGRLTPLGGLDPSFGNDAPNPAGDGLSFFDFGGEDDAVGLVLDSTGRVVVVGRVGPSGGYDVLLARLKADGSVDTSFGGPTGVHTDLGTSNRGLAIATQGDRLIVLASGTDGTYVLRYLSGGTLDPSFGGGDGIAPVSLPGELEEGGLLVEPSGDIVVSAGVSERAQIVRLQPDGLLDPTFGSGGVATFVAAEPKQRFYTGSLARMDDGRIIAAGAATYGGGEGRAVLIRTLPDGQPDPAWGSGGVLTLAPVGGKISEGGATVAVEPNRRILLGGEFFDGKESNRLLIRLLGDTTAPDTAITHAPPGTERVPHGQAEFAFAPIGDVNTTFECALTRSAPKKHHKKHHHKKRHHHKRKHKPKAHSSLVAPAPAFAPCSSPVSYPKLRALGGYRFAVRSTDPAGNVDPTPAEAAVHLLAKKPHKKHRRNHGHQHQRHHQR